LPTTWAMDSALQAIRGPESAWSVISGWLYCLLLCAAFLALTYFTFKIVEKRLRVTGLL